MDFDTQRLARYAPFAVPVVVLVAGWMLLVQPRVNDNARVARDIESLQQRLTTVRASLANPLPPDTAGNPVAAFERQVAAGDATSDLLEQLARLAASAPVANLLIETGDRVTVTTSTGPGPQAVSGAAPDPRFTLFNTPLAYSPVTMSFDAQYARTGELLWRLRDLATTVEIRTFEARPVTEEPGTGGLARRIHVSLALFAYSRQSPAAASGRVGVLR